MNKGRSNNQCSFELIIQVIGFIISMQAGNGLMGLKWRGAGGGLVAATGGPRRPNAPGGEARSHGPCIFTYQHILDIVTV